MSELAEALVADSYAAAPAHILEDLTDDHVHRTLPNVPHTIYSELWHIAFWQRITLHWIAGIEIAYPATASDSFPQQSSTELPQEPWGQLRHRFLHGAEHAAAAAQDTTSLDQLILCPSRPGHPIRTMTIRDQLISLAAHNAYHFGRIVMLRQLLKTWPPASGGFTW